MGVPMSKRDAPSWWARGLLFENCRCQLVCPGHIHFDQLCTYDPCLGYWAMRFDDGRFGEIDLADSKAIVAFESPQRMIDGNWTQAIIIDEAAEAPQRDALLAILRGQAGGPWEVLARFVGEHLEPRFLAIEMEDAGTRKSLKIGGLMHASVEAIRGRDRTMPVKFENIFNQIHSPSQVIARGDTSYDDGVIVIDNEGSHGLYSSFDWSV